MVAFKPRALTYEGPSACTDFLSLKTQCSFETAPLLLPSTEGEGYMKSLFHSISLESAFVKHWYLEFTFGGRL